MQLFADKTHGRKNKNTRKDKRGAFMILKEDEVVMCTVKSIEGATIFLNIEGTEQTGSMPLSEVAAGRIRNLREYVTVNKKVVCKILKIINGHPQLSLRRVTGKEREEIKERYKKEKVLRALLATVAKDVPKLFEKIREKYELWRFYDEITQKPELLEQYLSKADAQRISQTLAEKKEKEKIAKKTFLLQSFSENGLDEIKEILSHAKKEVQIHYLGSSLFSLSATAKDFKEANSLVEEASACLEKLAKDKKVAFEIK